MAAPIHTFRPGHAGALASQEVHARKKAGAANEAVDIAATSKAADVLDSISSKAYLPQTFQFFGGMALGPIAWVAGKLGGAKAKTIAQAPLAAMSVLETTTLGNLHQLPEQVVRSFGAKAAENEAKGLAESAARMADRLSDGSAEVARNMTKRAEPLMHRAAVAMNGMPQLGGADHMVDRFADWRLRGIDKAAQNTSKKLLDAHAHEAVGMLGRVKQLVGMKAPVATESIQAAAPFLKVANGTMFHAEQADALRSAMKHVTEHAPKLDGMQQGRMDAVIGQAERLQNIINKKSFWQNAKTGGLGGILRQVPNAIARTPIARALLVLGVTAGGAAVILRTRAENTHSKALLNELAADIYGVQASQVHAGMLNGEKAPALLKHASQDMGKSSRGNWMAGAAQVAGEGLWLMPHVGAGAIVAGMGSGMVGDLVKSDNPYLNAYAVLKAEANGKGTLKPEEKTALVTMLVGATPSIAEHGGARNKLAKPIAEQMVAEKLTVQQIVREIALPQAIEKRAVAVKAAETAPKAAETEAAAPKAANENMPKPVVGSVQPQGRVVQQGVAAAR